MAEKMVRCPHCHEVFEAEEGTCPKMRGPYRPTIAQPRPIDGLYVERYAAKAGPTPARSHRSSPGRPRIHPLVFAGAILLVIALAAAAFVEMGAGGGAGSSVTPGFVVGVQSARPLQPTLPAVLALAYGQVADYDLAAQVTIQATVQLSSQFKWKTQSLATEFDGQVSEGDQSGTIQTGGTSQEIRLVDGLFYVRNFPSGKWSLLPSLPAYLLVCPVLGIDSTADLISLGPVMREGQMVNQLRSTSSWAPDISRIALTDLSSLPIKPTAMILDLWVGDDGAPLWASVSATNIGPAAPSCSTSRSLTPSRTSE